jgi:hypothetical protein
LFCHLFLHYYPSATANAIDLVSTYDFIVVYNVLTELSTYNFVVASVLFVGIEVTVSVVNLPVPGSVLPIFTLFIVPLAIGLIVNTLGLIVNPPIFVIVPAVNVVNTPVDGDMFPIATLFIDPVTLEVSVIVPVDEIATVPFDIVVFPLTVRFVSVPTLVKLLKIVVLGSDMPLAIDTLFILNNPVILTLPDVSTLNPGLENPASDRKGF